MNHSAKVFLMTRNNKIGTIKSAPPLGNDPQETK